MRLLIVCLVLALSGCAAQNRPLQLISGAGPVYPASAREQGIEGAVRVRYDVNVDGEVVDAQVISSTPPEIFDAAALQAVASWQFNAPLVNGERVPARGLVSTVNFRLSGGEEYEGY